MESAEDKLIVLMNIYKEYENEITKSNSEHNDDKTETLNSGKAGRLLTEAYLNYTHMQNKDSSFEDTDVLNKALLFCKQQKGANSTNVLPSENATPKTCDSPLFKPVLSDDTTKQNLEAEKEVRELSIKDKSPTPEIVIQNATHFSHPTIKPPKGQITMVQNQGKTYTRIGPPTAESNQSFVPSRHSAFRPALPLDGKRLRLDPSMQYLDPSKNKLSRSTSVPVYPEGEENTPPHRVLFRTASFVSNLTKQKLKNSILARTSAALVRKPSITDQEMRQIRSRGADDDSDSSQSEDDSDDFEEEPTPARKRKYSDEHMVPSGDHLLIVPPTLPTVITTASPT